MSTEKRLIPLRKRIIYAGDVFDSLMSEKKWSATEAAEFVKAFSVVDAVEVVHCCDCQKRTALNQDGYREPLLFCKHWKGHPMVDPTDFCSYGERRTDNE